jgi:D-beta-D-heptose 7-phosphate kinase/D-beta-D-heptose 1-phosphate adenosyltransferase
MRYVTDKIKDRSTLKEILDRLKRQGKKIIFTNGCFDLLHHGHVVSLEEARSNGDILVVGVNTDSSIRKLKGKQRPIINEVHRMAVLAALEAVDFVVPFVEEDPAQLISFLQPHVVAKGGDWTEAEIVGRDTAEQTLILPYLDGISTSAIITTILERFASHEKTA